MENQEVYIDWGVEALTDAYGRVIVYFGEE